MLEEALAIPSEALDIVSQKLFATAIASPPRRAFGNLTNDATVRSRSHVCQALYLYHDAPAAHL